MQNIKLNLIPGSVMPVVNVSQYDKARQFTISVYEGSAAYSLTGKDVQIRGTKPDGNGFAYDSTDGVVSVSGSTVTISTTQQMTAVGGQTMAELRITQSGVVLGTLNFVLMVEPSALSDDTPISDTDIPAIERDFEAALAEAEADALKAEGYAVGTQDGTPAQSGEPYYQDNAKYYKEKAEAAASGGGADALKAEGYAVGTQNGVPVTSGSPYYHNNAAYYEGEASTSATNAATSETNAGLSETAAGNSATSAAADALVSEGWAVGKQNGTPVTSGSPYYQNNAEYYKDQAAQYAAGGLIFKGSVAFASIPTTGMVNGDMYNITDDFTTDSRFIEGAGVSVKAGADIAWVAGSVNKWDILALGGGGGTNALDDLTDVNITNPTPGQVLKFDGSEWVNGDGGGGASDLDDLGDVTITTPTDGQVLTYDANTQTWVNGNGGGGGGGFDYKAWLQAASINPAGYADLAAVLADEETVRHLMTVHLSVDYLTGFGVGDTNIQTILNNDFAAKWINLRDYALDKLEYAFSALMASIDKYGYGEWTKLSESPETWGPKGNVPIMTSNTAPYGAASASSAYSTYAAYKAFDGDPTSFWSANTYKSGQYIQYDFVNPVKVIAFENTRRFFNTSPARVVTGNAKVQASNDGTNWTDLTNTIGILLNSTESTGVKDTYQLTKNLGYYLKYRIIFEATEDYLWPCSAGLQFYGREMKVSVPVMTSNTAPYGVASSSSVYAAGFEAYRAFDGVSGDRWADGNTDYRASHLLYQFNQKVVLKMMVGTFGVTGSNTTVTCQTKLSNDGSTWSNAGESFTFKTPVVVAKYFDNSDEYQYIGWFMSTMQSSTGVMTVGSLQAYGLDYSEYDWDADNPRHYLYDHGVELETIISNLRGTGDNTLTKEDSQLLLVSNSTTGTIDAVADYSSLSSFNLIRICIGNKEVLLDSGRAIVSSTKDTSGTNIAVGFFTLKDAPNNESLDISSVSAGYPLIRPASNGEIATTSITEWWLE